MRFSNAGDGFPRLRPEPKEGEEAMPEESEGEGNGGGGGSGEAPGFRGRFRPDMNVRVCMFGENLGDIAFNLDLDAAESMSDFSEP